MALIRANLPPDSRVDPLPGAVPQAPKDEVLVLRGATWQYAVLADVIGTNEQLLLGVATKGFAVDTNVWKEGPAPLGVEAQYRKESKIKVSRTTTPAAEAFASRQTYLNLGGLLGEMRPQAPLPTTTRDPALNTTTAVPTTTNTMPTNATTMPMVIEPNITARVVFRHKFSVSPAASQAKLYRLRVASNDYAHVYLNGELIDRDDDVHAYRYWNREVEVDAAIVKPFDNVIAVVLHNEWQKKGQSTRRAEWF